MMNTAIDPEDARLSPTTVGFALAAAVTVLFNTALAWAKDAFPALNNLMKQVGGHHWTTHGVVDLLLFVGLGFLFTGAKVGKKMGADRLTKVLSAAVVVAAVGLGLWYVFV